jgi:UTP--glucose-1-phosphate uridylyltransferase
VNEFTPEQQALLDRFGFDAKGFEARQRAVAREELSAEHNQLGAPPTAAPDDAIRDLPRNGSADKTRAVARGQDLIKNGELGIVVLNGGMATRFGGVVKGVVEVANGHSFLALKVLDALRVARDCGGRIPIYVLNSFATDSATRQHFEQHDYFGAARADVRFLTQFIAPRLNRDGSLVHDGDGKPSFYAPGHGDFSEAMRRSGSLAQFMGEGGRYVFLSNVDNLGARVSAEITGLHSLSGKEVTVEVAPKWPGDQGGAPAVVNGKLQVVEGFRFPTGFDQDSIPVFNCNTFTFNADALDRDFALGWYYVEKKLDGKPVVQLEHLVGELTKFLDAQYLRVKRTGAENRFFPIKTPEDLEAGKADLLALLGL